MSVNFRVVDGDKDEDLESIYESFRFDYMNSMMKAEDLKKKYDLNQRRYSVLINMVEDREGFKRKASWSNGYFITYNRKGAPVYNIRKRVNGKDVYFGCYPDLKHTKLMIKELSKVGWDRSLFPLIQYDVMLKLDPMYCKHIREYNFKDGSNRFDINKQINKELFCYGYCSSLKVAQEVVRRLIRCDWDKGEVGNIESEVDGYSGVSV